MNQYDEQLERLISRRLDDMLTPAEALELDKRLLRDPKARQLFESTRVVNELAAECIDQVSTTPRVTPHVIMKQPRRRRSWLAAIPIAAAACAAVVVWVFRNPEIRDLRQSDLTIARRDIVPEGSAPMVGNSDPSFRLADFDGALPRQNGRRLDYYGVVDDDTDSIYLLTVERRRTAKPQVDRSTEAVRLVWGDM